MAGLGGATARRDLGAAADQTSALRKRTERLAVAQRVQSHGDDGAEREALDGDALLRDRGCRSELDAPGDRLAVGADGGLAVIADDLEQELRVVRAGNEADEFAGVRHLLRLVVHRERMVRVQRGRDEGGCDGTQSAASRRVFGRAPSLIYSVSSGGDVGADHVSQTDRRTVPEPRSRAAEAAHDLVAREAGDRDALARGGSAGGDGDCIFLKAQSLGQQLLERAVRAAILRRRLDPDLQRAFEPADDLVAWRRAARPSRR